MKNDSSSPTLTNVTFSGNHAGNEGGGMANSNKSNPIIQNSILWGNSDNFKNSQITNYNEYGPLPIPIIRHSLIQRSEGSGANWDTTLGTDGGGNIDTDPLFLTLDNLHLQSESPAINAGDNSFLPPTLTTDLDGNPRIIAGVVDMGAYECQVRTFRITGQIGERYGAPIADVLITASNGVTIMTSTTDSNGKYKLTSLVTGTYTIIPTFTDYAFNPVSQTVSLPPTASGVDFTAIFSPTTAHATRVPIDATKETTATSEHEYLEGVRVTVAITSVVMVKGSNGVVVQAKTLRIAALQSSTMTSKPSRSLDRFFRIDLLDGEGNPIEAASIDPPLEITIKMGTALDSLTMDNIQVVYQKADRGWSSEGITITKRDERERLLTLTVSHLTRFGLVGGGSMLYLPIVLQ